MVHYIHTPFRVMAEDLHTKGKFNVLQVSQAGSHMGDYESSKICNDKTKGKNLTSFTFARHCMSNFLTSNMFHIMAKHSKAGILC